MPTHLANIYTSQAPHAPHAPYLVLCQHASWNIKLLQLRACHDATPDNNQSEIGMFPHKLFHLAADLCHARARSKFSDLTRAAIALISRRVQPMRCRSLLKSWMVLCSVIIWFYSPVRIKTNKFVYLSKLCKTVVAKVTILATSLHSVQCACNWKYN